MNVFNNQGFINKTPNIKMHKSQEFGINLTVTTGLKILQQNDFINK